MSNQDNTSAPTGGTPAWGTRRGPVVPYVPGLDGLRALAVIAVITYHANREWLGGGFLGVEVFFVISGYLITLLLIAERERNGSVSLGNFWVRRARRYCLHSSRFSSAPLPIAHCLIAIDWGVCAAM